MQIAVMSTSCSKGFNYEGFPPEKLLELVALMGVGKGRVNLVQFNYLMFYLIHAAITIIANAVADTV